MLAQGSRWQLDGGCGNSGLSLFMNAILQPLLKLQTIEFGPKANSAAETEAAALRAVIPETVLAHYERFRARGKKGIAVVSNQVCSGCHMSLTIGKLTTLKRDTDIERC